MSEVSDLVTAIIDKDPLAFSSAFDDIMSERIADAVEDKKIEVAKTIYTTEDVEIEEELDLEDLTDEDFELDDEDLEFVTDEELDLDEDA